MPLVTKTNTFSNGQVSDATQVNTDFDTLYNLVNGNLDTKNLASYILPINVRDYGAKGDGVTDDTAAIQSAINAASASVGVFNVFLPAGTYIISSQITIPSYMRVVGAGRDKTIIKTSYAGFAFKMNYTNIEIRDLTIQGNTATQASAVASGIDMTGTPHYWELHNLRFVNLIQAFVVKGGWIGTVKDVNVMDCGTSSLYACWLGVDGSNNQTNNVNYTNFHIEGSGSGWNGQGLYIQNYDHSFHGLMLEHISVSNAFTSDADGVVISGLYLEQNTISTDNAMTFNKPAVINGGYVNANINANSRMVFKGTKFSVNPTSVLNMSFEDCTMADNRFAVNVNASHIHQYPLFTQGIAEIVDVNSMSCTFEEWGVGFTDNQAMGFSPYYGGSFSTAIVNGAGQFLTGTRGLQVTINGSSPNGSLAVSIPSDLTAEELYAWAIIKVPASQSIQCSFGFGAVDFSVGSGQLIAVNSPISAGNWILALVGPFVPTNTYLTFNINKSGGGTDTVNGENFFIDSFGICKHGINYQKLFNRTKKELEKYRYMSAAPTVGTWAIGDKVFNSSASGNEGWVCVTAGTPGTWQPFGMFAAPSATAAAVATSGTITTSGVSVARVAPTAAATGVILQAGTFGGQEVWVINEAASANSVTFAAASSNVADGSSDVINGGTARKFVWDAGNSLWYRAS